MGGHLGRSEVEVKSGIREALYGFQRDVQNRRAVTMEGNAVEHFLLRVHVLLLGGEEGHRGLRVRLKVVDIVGTGSR